MVALRSTGVAQAAVVVAAATAGVLIANAPSSSAGTPPVHWTTVAASRSTVTDRISATGTVSPDATLDLAFGVSNQPVTAVKVHVGQRVRAGAVLATVDPRAARAAVTAAEAAVTAATAAAADSSASPASGSSANTSGSRSGAGTTVCRTTTVTTRPLPSSGATPDPTASPEPTGSPSPSETPGPTSSPTPSVTPTPTASPTPSTTLTPSATPASTSSPTGRPSQRTGHGGSGTPITRPTPSPMPSTPGGGPASYPGASNSGTTVRTTRTCTTTSRGATTPTTTMTTVRGSGGTGGGSAAPLTVAQQQLSSAQAALAATTIVAPRDGVVSAVDLTVGTLPGTPAVELRTSALSVQVPVAEQDAPYVEPGQQVDLTYPALGVAGVGRVAAAPLEPSTGSSGTASGGRGGSPGTPVVTYPVTVTISDPPPGLLLGMSVQASWVAQTREGVLAVPTSAIQGGDGGYVVRVLRDGQPQARQVSLGLSTSSTTEITRGLASGDEVVIGVR